MRSSHRRSACQRTKFSPLVRRLGTGTDSVWLASYYGWRKGSIREVAQQVASKLGLPLEFSDERLSSSEAKRSLREQGFSEKEMRGKVDMIAASLFLQSWLDKRMAGSLKGEANES